MRKMVLIGLAILALVVRLPLLNASLWMDEAGQALESMRPLSKQLEIAKDFQPPLYHFVVFPFVHLSQTEWFIRLASVIPGVLSVVFVYLIGEQIAEKTKQKKQGMFIGGLAAILTALSAFHVFFSQELRQYIIAAWWGVASWHALFGVLKDPKNKRWWVYFILSTMAGWYSMYVYPFLTAAQWIYIWFFEKERRSLFTKLMVVSFAGFAVWIPGFLEQLKVGTTLQTTLPGWSQVVSYPQWKVLPLVWIKFLGGGKPVDATVFDALYFGLPTLLLGFLFWKKRKQLHPSLFFWGAGSILLAWLVSFVIPVVQPKRVLFAFPALYLVIGQAVSAIKQRKLRNLIVGIAVCYQSLGLYFFWTLPVMQRENWRETIQLLHATYAPNDSIAMFGFTEPFAPWIFYEQQRSDRYPTVALDKMPIRTMEEADILLKPALQYKRVLVFDYLRDLTDPNRIFEQWLEKNGYTGVHSVDTRNIGFIRIYER